jgi:hypothetical protein
MLVALTGAAAAALPDAAHAEASEWAVSLGGFYRGLSTDSDGDGAGYLHGAGAHGAFRYGLDDFWQLGASLEAGVSFGAADPGFIGAAALELHWIVDIVTWVPYLTVSAGALARAPSGDAGFRLDALVGIGGGIDYRPERAWSVGLSARAEFPLTDLAQTPVTYVVALSWTTYFE